MKFKGLFTALVTPFDDGKLDEECFRSLVRRQIDSGVDGIVPCGTTGEAPTLSVDEHVEVVRWAVEEADGKVPVMAGIGSNSTATAVATGIRVEALGADGVLATAPYYNKPTQEGLYQHFRTIAEAINVDVCLYDVPGRSVVNIEPATVERLSVIDNITCLKDATGDMANAIDVLRRCGDRITLLSGDDFTTLPFLALGGSGVISVASNIVPEQMAALVGAAREGRMDEARNVSDALFPLFQALFLESNPIPAKAAMAHLNLLKDELRLPLTSMSAQSRARLLDVLTSL